MLGPEPRPHPLSYRPKLRLPKGRRMSLIIALPCRDGVVICADSRETAGHYKVGVKKAELKRCGRFDVVFGGAGNDGNLSDGLRDSIYRELNSESGGNAEDTVRAAVAEYYRN